MDPQKPAGHSPHGFDPERDADRRALHHAGRLLIVSPEPDEREMYADYLRGKGYCVLETPSAEDACWLMSEVWLSAVITDLRLGPRGDSPGLVAELRREAGVHQVPIVILAGYRSGGTSQDASRTERDLVLLMKPCLPSVLGAVVEQLMAAHPYRHHS